MDQKSKTKVPPLPAGDDDFWKGGQNEKCKLGDSIICDRALHNFLRVKGNEAQCMKCRMGFYLPIDSDVKDGHIYIKGTFLI